MCARGASTTTRAAPPQQGRGSMSADARPLAGRLLAAGVPVVVVRYGEKPPAEWQHLTAEERHLSAYRPGRDALALVGGHGIDLVDEDTKDAGSADNLPPFQALRRDPDPDRRAAPRRALPRGRREFAADHPRPAPPRRPPGAAPPGPPAA